MTIVRISSTNTPVRPGNGGDALTFLGKPLSRTAPNDGEVWAYDLATLSWILVAQGTGLQAADNNTITGLWSFANAGGLKTDVIAELTPAAGVTIDGVLLKDGGGTFTAPVLVPDGTIAAPGMAYADQPGTGFFRPSTLAMGFAADNQHQINWIRGGTSYAKNMEQRWTSADNNAAASIAVRLSADLGGGILMQHNATTSATEYQLYETRTNSTNYSRLAFRTAAGDFTITPEADGTGTLRDLVLGAAGMDLKLEADQTLLPNGSAIAPAITFTDRPDAGMWQINGVLTFSATNQARMSLSSVGVEVQTSGGLAWSTTSDPTNSQDLFLVKDAADIMAQRRTTNAQEFRVYGTYTNSTNYTRLSLADDGAGVITIGAETEGTGADDIDISLVPAGVGSILIPDGLQATPALALASNPDTGFFFQGSTLGYSVDNTFRFGVAASGATVRDGGVWAFGGTSPLTVGTLHIRGQVSGGNRVTVQKSAGVVKFSVAGYSASFGANIESVGFQGVSGANQILNTFAEGTGTRRGLTLGSTGVDFVIAMDATRFGNDAEGLTGSVGLTSSRQVVAMGTGATAVSTTITVPDGARLIGVALNVDVAVTNDGDDTWSAAFSGGSTTEVAAAGSAATLNTKKKKMILDEIVSAATEVTFTPQSGNFTAGSIEVVVWYFEMTDLADA